ncbi:hypothetical protein V7S57_13460 [Caulobacter sp. CCNWLY153]|uniref:hypothetical protein n=1 Tax=unclassified Caulobacter TaxID=2648921 RepID=UPI002FF25C4E
MSARAGENGFAMVAALGALMLFAYLSYTVLASDRAAVAGLDAGLVRARLEAAADAGVATAIHHLGDENDARRWFADGRPRELDFDDCVVTIALEDERGKAPLNSLSEARVRRMFEAVGATGAELDRAVAGFLGWRDGVVRPEGPRPMDYAARGLRPIFGRFTTVDEMALIPGVRADWVKRLRPAVTVHGDGRDFEPRLASPLALRIMRESGDLSPDSIRQGWVAAGQRPRQEIAPREDVAGRPVTIRAMARNARGDQFQREIVVEFTGVEAAPYWIRAVY